MVKQVFSWRSGLVAAALALLSACGSATPAVTGGGTLPTIETPGAVIAAASVPESNPALAVGSPAPDFLLAYADGNQVRLSDLRGRPVILNFWATWCGPCRVEMPDLVRTYQDHAEDGLVVIGVNFQEGAEEIKAFAEEFDITFPLAADAGDLARAYQVRVMPSSYFIDKDGKVSTRWLGVLTPSVIEKNLAAIDGP